MSSNRCIIPECNIDSCLINVLLQTGRYPVNHTMGNGTVAKKMKGKFSDKFCIGVIDEDRKPLDYLKEFTPLCENEYLKLWRHEDDAIHHYIIQIRPVIEKWILSICGDLGIMLTELPQELKALSRISKSVESMEDPRFVRLFKSMVKQQSEPVLLLKNWLEYLKANEYNADINKLING